MCLLSVLTAAVSWSSAFSSASPCSANSSSRTTCLRSASRECLTHTHSLTHSHTLTLTHTHTHVGFCGLWGLSIGVMVFILNKLCVLLPYTYPTPKLSPHRRLCASLDFQKKHHLVCFLSLLNYGDIGSVLIKHLQIVIPLSYPCYYTNLCPQTT